MTELRGPLASTGYWLKLAALAYQRELDADLRPLGLTTTQFSVLAGVSWLGRGGDDPPTQQEIADFAGIDRMMTSKILAVLGRRKLVQRRKRGNDGRVRCVVLTDKGRATVAEAVVVARRVDHRLFGEDQALRDLLLAKFGHLAGKISRQVAPTVAGGHVPGSAVEGAGRSPSR